MAAALMGVYLVASIVLLATKDFDDKEPLSFNAGEPLQGPTAQDVADRCFPAATSVDVFGAVLHDRLYYACYNVSDDGSVRSAKVVNAQGRVVNDAGLIKESGAWPWIATVDNATDLVFGAFGLGAILGLGWLYGRRGRPPAPAPGAPWWSRTGVLMVLALIPCAGWLVLAVLPRVDGRRKARAAIQAVF